MNEMDVILDDPDTLMCRMDNIQWGDPLLVRRALSRKDFRDYLVRNRWSFYLIEAAEIESALKSMKLCPVWACEKHPGIKSIAAIRELV